MIISQLLKNISKGEWRFVLLITAIAVLLSTLPYFYGYFISADYFLWSNYTNFGDISVYESLINQAATGRLFFDNLFTSEFKNSFFFQPLFLALGLFSRITGISSALTLQLGRIFLASLFLVFSYIFIAYFLNSKLARKICFLLMCFGAGIGALVSPPYHQLISYLGHRELFLTTPADLYLPEANIFSNIFYSPLLPLALLLDLLVLYLFINTDLKLSRRLATALYFLVVFLGFIHPFDLIALAAITSFFVGLIILRQFLTNQKQESLKLYLAKFLIIVLAIISSAIYYLVLIKFDPSFSSWSSQNITESPPLANMLLGYGFLFLLAVLSLARLNFKDNKNIFLVSWIFIILFFAYIPFQYQRRLLSSVFIPICILAALVLSLGLEFLFRRLKNNFFRFSLILLIILLFSLSNISTVWSNVVLYNQPDGGFYLSKDYFGALEWFKDKEDQVILATPFISNSVPAISLNKVYVGHVIQSFEYERKYKEVKDWFFKSNIDDFAKQEWLFRQNIDYIIFGPLEKSLGNFNPGQKNYLKRIYLNSTVAIYQVVN